MYCVNCGVRLADTEKCCPLCKTTVYHPTLQQASVPPLYPREKYPEMKPTSKAFNGLILIIFLAPLLISLLSDLQGDGELNWFGFVAGGLALAYVSLCLPLWFRRPNPVIFVPCAFAATVLYLLYVNLATDGSWFLSFAFPVTGGFALIVSGLVTLLRYLRRGRLYVWGGAFIALGGQCLLIEFLMSITFGMPFIGWAFYPLVILGSFGLLLLYLAIHRSAREMMERKMFF